MLATCVSGWRLKSADGFIVYTLPTYFLRTSFSFSGSHISPNIYISSVLAFIPSCCHAASMKYAASSVCVAQKQFENLNLFFLKQQISILLSWK